MRINLRKVITISSLLAVPLAFAFNISGERWPQAKTVIYSSLIGTASSGPSFQSALKEAMEQWNETEFQFELREEYIDPCSGFTASSSGSGFPQGDGDALNSMDFRSDLCGNSFGPDVLATTLSLNFSGNLGFNYFSEADIIFNKNYDWDVFSGSGQAGIDFRRVALHELGHVIGLGHELSEPAIMAPRLGSIDVLTDDDRAGVKSLYGGPQNCSVRSISVNRLVHDALGDGDCRVLDLFSAGSDTSFVDVYRLQLEDFTKLKLRMSSSQMDPVLVITDANLGGKFTFDDSNGSCDVDTELTLSPGEYLLLANTYAEPEKCAGNIGAYSLSVSGQSLPVLKEVRNSLNGRLAEALFSGGARNNGEVQYRQDFTAEEPVTVEAAIAPDPLHVGLSGEIYVLAVLSNGKQFMKLGKGNFVPYQGDLSQLQPLHSGVLQNLENISILKSLRGDRANLAGLSFRIFVGYRVSGESEIHYASPIAFNISEN